MFTREEIIDLKNTAGRASRGYTLMSRTVDPVWMPFFKPNQDEDKHHIKVVGKTITTSPDTEERPHTAIIAFDGQQWYLGCGGHFIDGTLSTDEAELIIAELAETDTEEREMRQSFNSTMKNTPCHHWRAWFSKGEICKHNLDLLDRIDEKDLKEIETHFFLSNKTSSHESNEELIAARMNTYAFKRHLLFTGEKGSGKTHNIYAYMNEKKLPHVFVGGNADVEAIDLKGNLLPYEKDGNKNFIWVDGPLTQVFRRAASGEKVILFIDELLMISPSAKSLLIPSLTTDNDGCYVLDTGRVIDVIDGVGSTECLRAPSENLWVLATTNIGAEYDVGDMESALEDRFEIIEQNNDPEKIERILSEIEADKGFNGVADKLFSFYEMMVALKDNNRLAKLINLRHLTQSLKDCVKEDDLYDRLMDRMPKWVERDMSGKLLTAQLEDVEGALARAGV